MPPAILALIETIVYAAARGAVRAYLDCLAERGQTVIKESPHDQDHDRAKRMRSAVHGMQGAGGKEEAP